MADAIYEHNGTCFVLTNPGEIHKTKADANIRIRNNSTQELVVVYVISNGKLKNGTPRPAARLKPFNQREVSISPRADGVFTLKREWGLGDKGDIVGSLLPEGGCPHERGIRSHAEWHIEC